MARWLKGFRVRLALALVGALLLGLAAGTALAGTLPPGVLKLYDDAVALFSDANNDPPGNLAILNKTAGGLSLQTQALKGSFVEVKRELNELAAKVAASKTEVDAIEVKADSLLTKVDAVKAKVDAVKTEVDKLEAKLDVPIPIDSCGSILAPGSYILRRNLTASGHCIIILANDVSLDLNGYEITGDGSGDGVTTGGALMQNIAVRNGTVRNFTRGVALRGNDHVAQGLRLLGNNGRGLILFDSKGGMALGNTLVGNGTGINAGNGSIVKDNTVINSTNPVGAGISALSGATVTGNTVQDNAAYGISAQEGSTVTGNTARGNTLDGIIIGGDYSTVTGNTSTDNDGAGFNIGRGSTVAGNTAGNNGYDGLRVDCPSNIYGNTARNNVGAQINELGGDCVRSHNLPAP